MQTAPDLNDFRLITHIAAHGALQPAADTLGVNHATVFKRLEALERELGVRLFERQSGRYTATLAGEEMARVDEQLSQQAEAALRKVAGYDLRPSGEVRLTSTESIASFFLMPLLRICQNKHPGIRLRLQTANHLYNLSKRDADIALRATTAPPDHLIGKKVGAMAFAIYANPGYCKAHPHTNWSEHQWIALDDSMEQHTSVQWLAGHVAVDSIALRSNSFNAIRQACIVGLGLAILPCSIADTHPELQRIGDPLTECQADLWLLTHPDLRSTVRVKTIFNELHEQMAALGPLLKGERG